jgi:hypothetical protein
MDADLPQKEIIAFMDDLVANVAKKNEYEVNGSIAYTAQTPWIRSKKIRDNICYNVPFDPEKYVDTVQFCEFERDILM